MPKYTVQLLSLRCLEAQEMDGDEVYIRFNGEKIWSAPDPFAMHHRPGTARQFDEFDFVNGRLHDREGWKRVEPFDASRFVFADQDSASSFQLWEADTLTRDDHLGSSRVSASDAGHGNISLVFDRDGARYMLTYRVTPETAAP